MAKTVKITNLALKLTADTRGLIAGVATSAKAIRSLGSAAAAATKRTASMAKSAVAFLNPFQAIMGGFAEFKLLAVGAFAAANLAMIKLAADMEMIKTSFEVLIGSASLAKDTLDELMSFAAQTPFMMSDVLGAAKMLLAYGTAADQLVPTLQVLGDAAAATGTDLQDLTYLFGTLRTQGRAYTIDIRQFAQRGIPIYEELAKVLKVDTVQMKKLIEEGKVGFPEVVEAFANMSKEGGRFHKMLERQSMTLHGLWSTLKDQIIITATEIGTALVRELGLKDKLVQVVKFLQSFRDNIDAFRPVIDYYVRAIKMAWHVTRELAKGGFGVILGFIRMALQLLDKLGFSFDGLEGNINSFSISFEKAMEIGARFVIGFVRISGQVLQAFQDIRRAGVDFHSLMIDLKKSLIELRESVGLSDITGDIKKQTDQLAILEKALERYKNSMAFLESKSRTTPHLMTEGDQKAFNAALAQAKELESKLIPNARKELEKLQGMLPANLDKRIAELDELSRRIGETNYADISETMIKDMVNGFKQGDDAVSSMLKTFIEIHKKAAETKMEMGSAADALARLRIERSTFTEEDYSLAAQIEKDTESAVSKFRMEMKQLDKLASVQLGSYKKISEGIGTSFGMNPFDVFDFPLIDAQQKMAASAKAFQNAFGELELKPVRLAAAIEKGSIEDISTMNQIRVEGSMTIEEQMANAIEAQLQAEREQVALQKRIADALERFPLGIGVGP